MTSSPSPATLDSLAEIANPEVRLLTTRMVRYLAEDDLRSHPVPVIARDAAQLADFACNRPSGAALVRVLDVDDPDSTDAVLQVATDDMPFLVDSVTIAVNRSGRTAHWIVHPLLATQRDANLALVSAARASANTVQPLPVESLILVECDRIIGEPERAAGHLEAADGAAHAGRRRAAPQRGVEL